MGALYNYTSHIIRDFGATRFPVPSFEYGPDKTSRRWGFRFSFILFGCQIGWKHAFVFRYIRMIPGVYLVMETAFARSRSGRMDQHLRGILCLLFGFLFWLFLASTHLFTMPSCFLFTLGLWKFVSPIQPNHCTGCSGTTTHVWVLGTRKRIPCRGSAPRDYGSSSQGSVQFLFELHSFSSSRSGLPGWFGPYFDRNEDGSPWQSRRTSPEEEPRVGACRKSDRNAT
jgi:hypothetical protein